MTLERNPRPCAIPSAPERARLARMRGSWQTDQPSDAEVERARIRWLSRTLVRPARGRPGALLVAAVVFGAAGALAATGAVTWPKTSADHPLTPPAVSAHPTAQPRSAPIVPRGVAPRLAVPRSTALLPDRTQLTDAVAPSTPSTPSNQIPVATSDPDSVDVGTAPKSGSRSIARFAEPSDPVSMSAEHEATNATPVSGAWQRAADALRQGDDQRATQALQELAASPDPYTRDTAALAHAQLDAAAGRWELALPVLRRLAATGSTPLLRRRAGEVLVQAPGPQ